MYVAGKAKRKNSVIPAFWDIACYEDEERCSTIKVEYRFSSYYQSMEMKIAHSHEWKSNPQRAAFTGRTERCADGPQPPQILIYTIKIEKSTKHLYNIIYEKGTFL